MQVGSLGSTTLTFLVQTLSVCTLFLQKLVAEDPRLIFATSNGVFVRDDWGREGTLVRSGTTAVISIAYGVDRQLIWLADYERIWEIEDVSFNATGNRFNLQGENDRLCLQSYCNAAYNTYQVSNCRTKNPTIVSELRLDC